MTWELSLTKKEVLALNEAVRSYPQEKILGIAKYKLQMVLADAEPII